ncbi:MAG: ABC transporter substrate-binding protein [Candidatus Geothermarchaeales archaeon]
MAHSKRGVSNTVLVAAVAIVALLVGAYVFIVLQPAEEEVVKLGALLPLSVPGSYQSGELMRRAMILARDQINDNGGVLGKPLEIIVEDSGSPEKATAATEKLITQDNVVAIVGEFHSSQCKVEIEIVHEKHIPFLIAECWSDTITGLQYEEVFRIAPYSSYVSRISYVKFIQAAGFDNIVMLAEDTEFGVDLDSAMKDALESVGLSYTSNIVSRTAPDFTSELLAFTQMTPAPDLLMNMVTGNGAYLIIDQAEEVGLDIPILGIGSASANEEIWEVAGDRAIGLLFPTMYSSKLEVTSVGEEFVQGFKERWEDREPEHTSMEAYDTVLMMVAAIEKAECGTQSPGCSDKIIEALETWTGEDNTFLGTRGRIYFGALEDEDALGFSLYHTWPEVPILIMQYTEFGQGAGAERVKSGVSQADCVAKGGSYDADAGACNYGQAEIVFPEEVKTAEPQY